MAGGLGAASFLGPSMARLTVTSSPTVWNHSALGSPVENSCLGLNFASAPATAQLKIRWKAILTDAVQKLSGTMPVYSWEDTGNALFQSHVSFRLPFNQSGTEFKDIEVIGMKCSTSFEDETEASAAALQELQFGRLRIRVMDVSLVRCTELEIWCYKILVEAFQLHHRAKSLLISWEEDMHKAECCYSPYRCKESGNRNDRAYNLPSVLRLDVADRLAELIKMYYLRLRELCVSTNGTKACVDSTVERIKYFFHEPYVQQVNEHRGSLPQEIKLCMKLILQEMTVSLGWQWPVYKVTCVQENVYVCEISLLPNHVHIGEAPLPLTITGLEASSEEEAVQNSCKATILALEHVKYICVVDLNYNHRSLGELYVVEARDQVRSASLMCSKVLCEWESMVDEIQKFEEECRKTATEYIKEQGNLTCGVDYTSMEAVAGLHSACFADLQGANDLFQNAST